MKKTIALLLALMMSLSLCGCSNGSGYDSNSLENTVFADLAAHCLVSYADVQNVTTDVTHVEEDGDFYYVKGKVTVTDEYGDKYVGKFDAEYELCEGEYDQISLDLETPTKEN